MPFVQVKLIEGVFDDAQKRAIVERLTDTMVEIEGENMRPVTWVRHRGGQERPVGHRRPADDDGGRQGPGRGRPRRLTRNLAR